MIKTKLGATVFSLGLALLILSPVRENWQEKPKDNFPLSYYPMFTKNRGEVYKLHYLVGYDKRENRHLIPYTFAGTGGFNQVRRQINKRVSKGEGDKLAQKVAKRVAKSQSAPYSELVRIEVVQGRVHIDNYFTTDERLPEEEVVIASQTLEKP